MRLRTILMGFVALVFGVSAATGVYILNTSSKSAGPQLAGIVVVTTDVSRGTNLTAEMIRIRPWPKELLPTGAITKVEDAVGRTVWIPLVLDEPVLEGKLAAKGTGRGMASLIPRGMRAMTIQTPNVATGVAGFILPGNNVDVLVTLSHMGQEDTTGGGGTLTLLQNVEILAVDQRIEAPSENLIDPKELRSVTLLVSPENAARLDLGQNKGTLSLSLRNPDDSATDAVALATLAELRGGRDVIALRPETPLVANANDGESLPVSVPVEAEVAPPAEPAVVASKNSPQRSSTKISRIRTLRGTVSSAVFIHEPATVAGGSQGHLGTSEAVVMRDTAKVR